MKPPRTNQLVGGNWLGLTRTRQITLRGVRALLQRIFTPAAPEQGAALDYADLTDEKLAWRRNLFTESEFRNGLTDGPVRGGNGFALTTLPGYANAVQFTQDGAGSYFYKQFAPVAGQRYVLSVICQMNDGAAPAFLNSGAADPGNDFVLVVKGDATGPQSYTVTPLGVNNLYRVSTVYTAVNSALGNWGVVKYGGNSSRGFKVTGYMLERSPFVTPYQAMTDVSAEFLAAFPLHSLYQDINGMAPVWNTEQNIAITLDMRLGGLRLGERTVNGDFSGASTGGVPAGWTSVGSATGTTSAAGVTIGPLGNSGGLSQDIAVPANAWVEIKILARKVSGTSDVVVWASNAASYANSSPVVGTLLREYSFRVLSPTGVVRVYLQAITGSGVLEVKSVSTREIPGNHFYQTTNANNERPVSTALVNQILATEQLNNGAWQRVAGCTAVEFTDAGPDNVMLTTLTGVAATTAYVQQANRPCPTNTTATVSVFVKAGTSPSSLVRVYNGNVSTAMCGVIVNWSGGVATLGSVLATWTAGPFLEATTVAGVYRLSGSFNTGTQTTLAVLCYPSAANTADSSKFGGVMMTYGISTRGYQRVGLVGTDYDAIGWPKGARSNGSTTGMVSQSIDFSGSDKIYAGVSFRKDADPATAIDAVLLEMGTLYTGSGGRVVLASSVGGSASAGFYVRGSTGTAGSSTNITPATSFVLSGGVDWNADTPLRALRLNGQVSSSGAGPVSVGGVTQTGAAQAVYLFRRGGTGTSVNGVVYRVLIRGSDWLGTAANADRWLNEPIRMYT